MDSEKMSMIKRNLNNRQVDEEDIPLPGFRFHPTDEELVGFYLRRKVDKKQLNIDLIRQIDIYKYDPWDLPLANYDVGDKEWYFFCRRGRKYRNSIRPNRVTCSGFWKATGIDRPIYSADGPVCIGLKKSLVYYRGSAGKGTKTEWMMHEFRLPPSSHTHINTKNVNHMDDKAISQEAEVWTLCRILQRSTSHKKTLPELRDLSTKRNPMVHTSSKACGEDSNDHEMKSYISFQPPIIQVNHHQNHLTNGINPNHFSVIDRFTSVSAASDQAPSATASSSSFSDLDLDEIIKHGDWDDLRSVVEYATADRPVLFM